MSENGYDLVVFGATSFVGRLLADYLLRTYGVGQDLTWAIAGRSESRLESLRKELGTAADDLPVIVADASDENALKAMCDQTGVVISTVGPYALFGEPLIKVCAETGTDYCDLTGEVQWLREMIHKYQATAESSGARIVNCCGFDSIPSDLGVYFIQQEAQTRFGQPLTCVKMRVKAAKGEFSGGTVASLLNVVKEASSNPELRKELANPYSVCPPNHGFTARQPNVKSAEYDRDFQAWTAPFVMAAINTRVVHRSNALSDKAYGADFRYDEAMMTGRGLKGRVAALGVTGALGGFMVGAAVRPTRWLLERFVVPKPGEGPSPEAQEKGFFDLRFYGETRDGESLWAKVTGDRDPGYGSTSKMLGQAGVCLAKDLAGGELPGGFWTPSTAMDGQLLERLRAYSGLQFELLDD
jgi:short subunit dehydrogenase-like uncharacterized protein